MATKCKPGCTCGRHRGKPRGDRGREAQPEGTVPEKMLPPGALSRAEVNDLISAIASLSACADALAEVSKLTDDSLDKCRQLCETINDRVSLVQVVKPGQGHTPPKPAKESEANGPRQTTEDEWSSLLETAERIPKRQLSFYDGSPGARAEGDGA